MTTEQKIQKLLDNMNSWDHETLLEWAKEARSNMLRGASPDVVDFELEAENE